MWSKCLIRAAVMCMCLALSFSAGAGTITSTELSGLSWSITNDTLGDAAGGDGYEVYGMGTAISGNSLYVVVRTNFDIANGVDWQDSYSPNVHLDPGDLYINVGGTFQSGTGTEYGVATTTHGNASPQAYTAWGSGVTAGGLYTADTASGSPMFADGTYEQYEHNYLGTTASPPDGDGNLRLNSYPTLIRYGADFGSDVAGVLTQSNSTDPWLYDLYYRIDLGALNAAGETIQLFWTMECGNDGVQTFATFGEIPEPTTIALLLSGAGVLAARRRKRSA
jgi:PEP-CTERM motif-containing protein